MSVVAVGIGSNLGDTAANVRRGFRELERIATVVRRSRLYRTQPWGVRDQPPFCNAVAVLETSLSPRSLLERLKTVESEMGRTPGPRWGPRRIDLDILTYGDRQIDEPDLQVPHPRLFERGFALIPLAEVLPEYESALAGLPPGQRESVALMSDDQLVERVRALSEAFLETDLMRLRIEEANEDAVELRRRPLAAPRRAPVEAHPDEAAAAPVHVERIKADIVGVVHFSRPAAREGERVEGDRELGYVEALGIRTPVRSMGSGRLVNVLCTDGQPVEYGQVLFEIDRA